MGDTQQKIEEGFVGSMSSEAVGSQKNGAAGAQQHQQMQQGSNPFNTFSFVGKGSKRVVDVSTPGGQQELFASVCGRLGLHAQEAAMRGQTLDEGYLASIGRFGKQNIQVRHVVVAGVVIAVAVVGYELIAERADLPRMGWFDRTPANFPKKVG